MIDCLSNGRLIAGVARGIPREYAVHHIPMAGAVCARASRRPSRSSRGPGPRTCSPTRANSTATRTSRCGRPGAAAAPADLDADHHRARSRSSSPPGTTSRSRRAKAARAGCRPTSSAFAAALHARPPLHAGASQHRPKRLYRRQQGAGGEGSGTLLLYFNRCLFSHGNVTETALQRQTGYSAELHSTMCGRRTYRGRTAAREFPQPDYARCRETGGDDALGSRGPGRRADHRGGGPNRCRDRARADEYRALPHDMFMISDQAVRGKVLPRLQAHEPRELPAAAQEAHHAAAE